MSDLLKKKWYKLGLPWCHSNQIGTAILAGDEDPHRGVFVCDTDLCEDREQWEAEQISDHIINLHNNSIDYLEQIQTLEARIKELESERDLLEKRLQFLNFYSAKICHTNDCEYCYVAWDYEEDSFSTPLMNTMEEAIDAAILIAKSPKGE